MDDSLQLELTGSSFTQSSDTSILEFTHPLSSSSGVTVSDTSYWIYAVGNPTNVWTGKHSVSGGFQLALVDPCLNASGSSGGGDGGDTTTPTDNTGYVSGGNGEQESDDGQDYYEDSNGSSYDSSTASGIIFANPSEEQVQTLFLIHGICMAIAWGLLSPLAIGASFVRRLQCLSNNARWFKIHMYLNFSVLLLNIAGFGLGFAAVSKNGDEHFAEDAHTKIGLAVFCLVLVQVFLGYFRPHAPHALPAATDATTPTTSSSVKANNSRQGGSSSISKTIRGTDDGGSEEIGQNAVQEKREEQPKAEQKTTARLAWEIGHRLLGVILVALAWTNCTTGIEIYTEDYSEADNATILWTFIFWCITGGIGVFMLLLGVVQRVY
jgi:hypothetical protein